MKSNVALQSSLNLSRASQKVWYAAHVLKAACTSSSAVQVQIAVAPVLGRPAIIAQTQKLTRLASTPVTAANNTTGFGFGELYLNSPAYPIGTAIPAIPAKPASAAVVGSPAVLARAAKPAVSSPAVVALPNQQNAIVFDTSDLAMGVIVVRAEFPTASSVGIVGSTAKKIAEITPSTLQATAWIGDRATGTAPILGGDLATETLEGYLYRNMKLLPGTTEQNMVNGLLVTTPIYVGLSYSNASGSLQFDRILDNALIPEASPV